jgi:hypothetical protein
MFEALKESSGVGDAHTFNLRSIDCDVDSLSDRTAVAAFTLRKLQALYFIVQPGILTKNSIVMFLAADLNLSLTEMAAEALRRGHNDVHDLTIDGRNLINKAAYVVSTIVGGEIVVLT